MVGCFVSKSGVLAKCQFAWLLLASPCLHRLCLETYFREHKQSAKKQLLCESADLLLIDPLRLCYKNESRSLVILSYDRPYDVPYISILERLFRNKSLFAEYGVKYLLIDVCSKSLTDIKCSLFDSIKRATLQIYSFSSVQQLVTSWC